jgi:hypothetical protein
LFTETKRKEIKMKQCEHQQKKRRIIPDKKRKGTEERKGISLQYTTRVIIAQKYFMRTIE